MLTWKESAIKHKYAELPDKPKYKKKKKKKNHIKSDHKHRYACVVLDCDHHIYVHHEKKPCYYIGVYCTKCGRLDNVISMSPTTKFNLPVLKINFQDMFRPIDLKKINLN